MTAYEGKLQVTIPIMNSVLPPYINAIFCWRGSSNENDLNVTVYAECYA